MAEFPFEGRPQLKDLCEHIIPSYAPQWRKIGTRLGLSIGALDIISNEKCGEVEPCCRSMFEKWLEIDQAASWATMNEVVLEHPAGVGVLVRSRDYNRINLEEPRVISKYGPDEQPFVWPCLLANGPGGELIVGNNSLSAIQLIVFDEQLDYKNPLQVIGGEGDGVGMFRQISGIAVDKKGYLYAADFKLHRIQKFTLSGEYDSQFGTKGKENGQFDEPWGLTFSKLNLLFVCDRKNHRIQAFQGEGYFYKFGQFNNEGEPGTFNQPVDVTLNNSEDKLFVSDWGNHRVQVFEPNGNFLTKIESRTDIPGFTFKNPDGIFFTPDNHLLVSSTERVLILKEDGSFVSMIEGMCSNSERFKDCIGIIMMKNGKIVIADGLDGSNGLIVFQ